MTTAEMGGVPARATAGANIAQTSAADAKQPWQLWNKDIVPFVRDLLFVLAIFAYVIGFAHHSAKMSAFGLDTQLADQPLDSLFNWAAESIQGGWPGFAIILIGVVALLFVAEYTKQKLENDRRCRPVVYSVATGAMLLGLGLTFAWSSHEGRCSAARFENAIQPRTALTLFMAPTAHVPGLTGDTAAPPPVYILGETNDMYQLLVTTNTDETGSLLSVEIPRSLVQSIEFRPSVIDAPPAAAAPGQLGQPSDVPTADPVQGGTVTPNVAATPPGTPSACWAIDRAP